MARTGELTVGTSLDLVPYSYFNEKGEWVGYSVDILNILKSELEEELGKSITVRVKEQGGYGAERIPQLLSREIDIACETQFTWERDRFADFSLSYSLSAIRLMYPKGAPFGSPESLAGKNIAVVRNSIGGQVMKIVQPRVNLIPIESIDEAIVKLKNRQVDAVAGDTIIMSGLKQKLDLVDFEIGPKDPYARYGLACMVPENDSTFLRHVNHAIVKMMQGYVIGDRRYENMINRWFGNDGIVEEVQLSELLKFFRYTIETREQIPIGRP